MNLLLKRDPSSRACTLGSLYVDDALFCFTLEDVVRADGVKVYGETAIPAGTYRVTLEKSKRFGRLMPYVHDVENFSGILFHWGSTAADTRGCVLVGLSRNADHLYHSRTAFEKLFPRLEAALAMGASISLTVEDAEPFVAANPTAP